MLGFSDLLVDTEAVIAFRKKWRPIIDKLKENE